MNNKEFKKQLVDQLEKYLRDRMEKTEIIREYSSITPLTLDELDEVCLKHNETFNAPEKFEAAKRTKLTKEEIDKMFDYLREYLLNHDFSSYPDPRVDGHIFMEVFEALEKEISSKDERYAEVCKYLRCTTAMRFEFINYDFHGFIGHVSGFRAADENNDIFIQYNECNPENSFVKNFIPILLHENIGILTITNKKNQRKAKVLASMENDGFYVIESDGFYGIEENKLYSFKEITSQVEITITPLENILKTYDCQFLKRRVYKTKELLQTLKATKNYDDMTEEEQEELDEISKLAAFWWLNQYKEDNAKSSDIAETTGEEIFITTLKENIKRALLEEGKIYLSTEDYKLCKELFEAQTNSGIEFNLLSAEMKIKNGIIKVRKGIGEVEVIYPNGNSYSNHHDSESGPKRK